MSMFGNRQPASNPAGARPAGRPSTSDLLMLFGGALKDYANPEGGNLSEAQSSVVARQQLAARKAAQASLDGFLGGQASDGAEAAPAVELAAQPGARTLSIPALVSANGPQAQTPTLSPNAPRIPTLREALPALLKAQAAGLDISGQIELLKAARPELKYFNTSDAIVGVDPTTNSATPLYRDAPKAPTAPIGYRWVGDTLVAIPGGPADPKTVGALSGVRRDAVVSRPTPSRARSGGGGMKLPAGFVLDGQ